MKKVKSLIWIVCFFIPYLLNAQELLDGIAAIVGDEVILHSEVNQFAIQLSLQARIDIQKAPERFDELRKLALENLIVQKVLLAKAKEDTVKVDDDRVEEVLNNQIQTWAQQLGSEAKIEEYFGMPISKIKRQFRDEIRNQLMVETVQTLFMNNIKISRPEVEKFYYSKKDSLPEMREVVHLRHILREIRAGGKGREEALKKIQDIRQRILNGEDFAELARKYSEDPGSARNGGELGFIQRGDFVREFEEVAFALKEGEISNIVETQFGFHIIQLLERRGEKINVRHILISLKATENDAEYTRQFLAGIRDSILAGASFEEMARRYSDDQTSAEKGGDLGWFETEQLQLPEFKAALQNLKDGDVSEPFRTQFGYHIIQLVERRKGGKLTLENGWEQLEQMALNFKRQRELQKWVEELKKNLYIEIKAE